MGLAAFTCPAAAQENLKDENPTAPRISSDQQLVSIDFNNVDIGVFIKFISDLTKKNFVIDERVRGKVSIISPGKITVAEAYRVFESVLEVHGFAAVPAGEIIKIITAPDARTKSIKTRLEEENPADTDAVVTQIIPLRYADPEEIKRLFTPLVSRSAVILSYAPTNTLIITDVQSNINRLMKMLKAIDVTGVGQQIAIIPVEYADATKMVNLLNSIFKATQKGKPGSDRNVTFVADERTNSIVMLASEGDTDSIRQLVKSLDKETPKGQAKIHVYYLEHASAEELAKVLQDIPSKETAGKAEGGKPTAPVVSDKVRITADKATNSLIIMAEQEDFAVLQSIIRKIDIPRAMVYIEALIMEVNVNKDFRLGTEWMLGGETSYSGKEAFYGGGFGGGAIGGDAGYTATAPINTAVGNAVTALPPGFSLGLFGESLSISGIKFPSIGAVVQAYQKDSDVHILSTPQILTTDNQEARIYVGKNVPFQTQAGVPSTSTTQAYNSFEYRDVGKTLKITPTISKDRMVRLQLSLEVTDIQGGTTEFRPTTLKRTVDTTAIVKDRNTIVLGGLIDDTISTNDYKVPCLGDVPGFGALFRSTAKGNTKTNLYVFLTPRVIQNPEEAKNISSIKKNEFDKVGEDRIPLHKNRGVEPDNLPGPRIESYNYNQQPEESEDKTTKPEDDETERQPTGSADEPTALSEQQAASLADETPLAPSLDSNTADSKDRGKTEEPEQRSPELPIGGSAEIQVTKDSQITAEPPARQDAPAAISDEKQARQISGDSSAKGYTIQIISLQDVQTAEKLIKELAAQGYAAYMVRSEVGDKVWYRLRIGYFEQPTAAQEDIARLRQKNFDPILIKL